METNYSSIISKLPKNITLIAVSKNQPTNSIQLLYNQGHRNFGENYVQELLEKNKALHLADLRWHFIGHLQRNKVKSIVNHLHAIHSVDSLALVCELIKHRDPALPPLECFLQINIDEESTKGGLPPNETPHIWRQICEKMTLSRLIQWKGLMTVPRADSNENNTRAAFQRLQLLSQKLPGIGSALSIGMSQDYKIALEEGATHIRLGTLLFGARLPTSQSVD